MSFKINIVGTVQQCVNSVNTQLPGRAFAAANELRSAVVEAMRGSRGGKTYRKPGGGTHVASAPGEPPAVRTGTLRGSWRNVQYGAQHQNPAIETDESYAGYMEYGTPGGKIKPRPFSKKTIDLAKPAVLALYAQPFKLP